MLLKPSDTYSCAVILIFSFKILKLIQFQFNSNSIKICKGWGIERQEVYQGIIASGIWIGIWLVVGIAVIRSRKYTG